MQDDHLQSRQAVISNTGLKNILTAHWNLTPHELTLRTIAQGLGQRADTGALVVDTGQFTGRSPKDRYIVCDKITEEKVWWGDINQKFDPEKFDTLLARMEASLSGKEVYIRDAYACADTKYRLKLRIVTELPWQDLFAHNLFLRPTKEEVAELVPPDWIIISVPSFSARPAEDGTRQGNFTIINFTKRRIIIGGSAYAGEIKKAVFSVLNFLLPVEQNVLPMHCSANIGREGDTAIFFGLSGTGKTTLSADKERRLIGDDEHGWSEKTIFNFEGGCYAKCVNLSKEHEPEIWSAIREGTVLENVKFFDGTTTCDYANIFKTENTRAAYPIENIANAAIPSVGTTPKNIFFLTCDAYGILPPIAKLTREQAMYYFLSGYTAKVAGTEVGVREPQATFSACFGQAFLPLHPTLYAKLLGEKLEHHTKINVWLVNTGWSGGAYGVGSRLSLAYTRALIRAALAGTLDAVPYEILPIFGLQIPKSCPDVPSEILNPRDCWTDRELYDKSAEELGEHFRKNFEQYEKSAPANVTSAGPQKHI